MKCDFEIEAGIYLVQGSHELDLHNSYEFREVVYFINSRNVTLKWQRSTRPEVSKDIPLELSIQFRDVTAFEFSPRDPDLPFSEDDCMGTFGNWIGEHGVGMFDDGISGTEEPVAIDFMSGATIIISAASAHATIS